MNEKKEFNFWQDHSVNYLEMAFGHTRRETVENPDGYGKKSRECGDTIEMYITMEKDAIHSISYNQNGCMHANACANTVGQLAENKSIKEAWEITAQDIIDYLETLPENEHHCAELAVETLRLALNDVKKKK